MSATQIPFSPIYFTETELDYITAMANSGVLTSLWLETLLLDIVEDERHRRAFNTNHHDEHIDAPLIETSLGTIDNDDLGEFLKALTAATYAENNQKIGDMFDAIMRLTVVIVAIRLRGLPA